MSTIKICPTPAYRGLSKINYIMALPGLKIRNCKFWLNYLEEVGEIICLPHKSAGFANASGLQKTHQAMPKDADWVGLGDLEHLFSLEPAE